MTLLCLCAIWLIGFGLVRCMFPQPLRWSLHNVLLFSLGIGAGAGVASCLYFCWLVVAGPNVAVLEIGMGAALVIALGLGLTRKSRGTLFAWKEGPAAPWYLTALLVLAGVIAAAIFLAAVSYHPQGEEGAWSIWNLRARFLVRAGGFWRDAFSSDLSWSHPDYPLLISGLVALCWELAGQESSDAPIAMAFLFAFGTAAVLVGTLGILRGKTHAFLAGTLLLGTASYIALSAALYGDVPLGFYILATLALLCLQDRHPENLRFSALAGLMAGFGAWTRNEGIIFVIAVIAARAIGMQRGGIGARWLSQFLRFAAGLAAPLAIVIFFKLRVGGGGGLLTLPISSTLKHLQDPARWILMVQALVVSLFSFGRFLLPVVLVLALYWYLLRFQTEERDKAMLTTAGVAIGLTFVIQLAMDMLVVDNLAAEVGTSLERALLQLWPAGLLMFFLASREPQLVAPPKRAEKAKLAKLARGVAGTR
jgi:Dolichyl-phosphate-mannose-protein mannosyltransferase